MSIQPLHGVIQSDFDATNRLITEELVSDVPLIQEIARHIIKSGGKRMRPTILLLVANALGVSGDEHHELAAVVEFIHTATLLHDDVVDKSALRRGVDTANTIWGNHASVLVGDFLYSRAFQILAKRDNVPVMKVLAHTTNALSEGEVMQLTNQNHADITEEDYYQTIDRKTAKLFEACSLIGAMLTTKEESIRQAMRSYGYNLGMAFQIIDDCIDYLSDDQTAGKNIGDDFSEGKVTLPLIYAFQHGEPKEVETIKIAIEQQDQSGFTAAANLIKQTHAADYCMLKAKQFIDQAMADLETLPNNEYRDTLAKIAQFVVERQY